MIKLNWCPEHTDSPDGCHVCAWLAARGCGCAPGTYCTRCNQVVMRHEEKKNGWQA